jgi:hypothetical protein
MVSYDSAKSVKFAELETNWMEKDKKLSPEAMEARIRELEQQLAVEKMCSESMCRMIEIAGRELNYYGLEIHRLGLRMKFASFG